jgi:NTE family protein
VIFPPVFIHGKPYVDGGLFNNLPIEPFHDKKNEIVSINVNPIKLFNADEGVFEMMDRAIHLSFREKVNQSSAGCYLFIEPKELNKYGLFDISKIPEIFDIGYNYTNKLLKKA